MGERWGLSPTMMTFDRRGKLLNWDRQLFAHTMRKKIIFFKMLNLQLSFVGELLVT